MKRPDLPANGPDLDDTGSGQWSGAFEPPKTESSVSLEDSETKIKSETTKALEMPTGREEEPLPGLCVSMDVEGVEKREDCSGGWEGRSEILDRSVGSAVCNGNEEQGVRECKKGKKKRPVSPVNSEEITIEPNRIKISDLCKDIRIGRKSVKFNEIRKMEAAKKRMRSSSMSESKNVSMDKGLQKACLGGRDLGLSILRNENMNVTRTNVKGAPQVRVVNGKIVIDETSLQVDRRERDVNPDAEMELVEENDLSRKVNSASWGKREKSDRWSLEETQRFYNALSQWGTDFGVICRMFPNRSQRQIKNKFNSEERKYPERINCALKSREPIVRNLLGVDIFLLNLNFPVYLCKNKLDNYKRV
ncbi:hypothetical protein MERGE_002465 [Pneumocystis wakefieldiae]|uniref:Myb-like domain-containing protein n=1 Tax=Pneumocystis wakefieldiae TaxID=38082 RepID=A0A899FME2_9ASCO|nr:hypothetical protein MERGE_002465 [Pneumocystis wakefieldiae]